VADIGPIVSCVNRLPSSQTVPPLEETQLQLIETLSRSLQNRKLQGFGIWNLETLKKLQPEEIDLARGLFVATMEQDTAEERRVARSYEAHIDLMALQILARLPILPTAEDKIRAINTYIFEEMQFRFPPHSLWVKDIDIYTLLPSVLDSRRGVCLGVSILYLSIAQRLALNLEAITPPGHTYLRHVNSSTSEIINIETTARGIDIPSEAYYGIETKGLQKRTVREVIGLAFMNQASVSWHHSNVEEAIKLYEKAKDFLPNDYLLHLFLGFNYLFAGRTEEGTNLLRTLEEIMPTHMISSDSIAEDYLSGKTDVDSIKIIFSEVDERRTSILAKQKKIQEVIATFPLFRQGIFHLAITYLQLGREKEAIPILERYITLAPDDPNAQYYLASIQFHRFHFPAAWHHLRCAEKIVFAKNHHPRLLQDLRKELQRASPEKL